MSTRYTQRQLAEMEKSLDDDSTCLKAEILELCIDLGHRAQEAYNGTYQQTKELRDLYQAKLTSIMDAMNLLSDSAGDLITAGGDDDDE